MKITSFDPIIVTPNTDSVIKVFESLGFEKKHAPVTAFEAGNVQSFRMENADGYHVDVVSPAMAITEDRMLIRMNVDDFDAAYGILTAHGFKNVHEDDNSDAKLINTKSSKAATMVSPSGFRIAVVQHIKN